MSMRKQFVESVLRVLRMDDRVVLLLGDIGVFGFRDAFRDFPDRVYNIGILEQATVGVAAGLAKAGLIPIVHTIAPFLTERCLEQIKIDFGYQRLRGSFVTVGASYDYAQLGCTHHCPGDVQVLSSIPGMKIVLPGCAAEFDELFMQNHAADGPTYYRLSDFGNSRAVSTAAPGQPEVLKTGSLATVVAVGTTLDAVLEATEGLDVAVLYYNVVSPFDGEALRRHARSPNILLCEPYYRGGLAADITDAMWPQPIRLLSVGVPRRFLTNYGNVKEHDAANGLTAPAIRTELERLINA